MVQQRGSGCSLKQRTCSESEEERFSDNSRQVARTRKLPKFIEGLRHQ